MLFINNENIAGSYELEEGIYPGILLLNVLEFLNDHILCRFTTYTN